MGKAKRIEVGKEARNRISERLVRLEVPEPEKISFRKLVFQLHPKMAELVGKGMSRKAIFESVFDEDLRDQVSLGTFLNYFREAQAAAEAVPRAEQKRSAGNMRVGSAPYNPETAKTAEICACPGEKPSTTGLVSGSGKAPLSGQQGGNGRQSTETDCESASRKQDPLPKWAERELEEKMRPRLEIKPAPKLEEVLEKRRREREQVEQARAARDREIAASQEQSGKNEADMKEDP